MPNGNESTSPSTTPNTDGDPLQRPANYNNDEIIELSKKFDDKNYAYGVLIKNLDLKNIEGVSSAEDLESLILSFGFYNDRKDPDAQLAIEKINARLTEVLTERKEELFNYVISQLNADGEPIDTTIPITQEEGVVSANNGVGITGDPINLFNGNFVYASTDFTINGAGMDFSFTRNYSQLSFFNSVLGYKWDHSLNLWLRLSSDTNLIFRSNGALREITYRRHTIHNYWFTDIGEDGIIFESSSGQYIWRSQEGIEYKYIDNLSGSSEILLIDKIEDRFGNYLQCYYEDKLLSKVEVNNPSRLVFFKYDNENRIIAVSDFTRRSWQYTYDDMGDLVAVTTPPTQEFPKGLTTCYEYSSYQFSSIVQQHNLLCIIDASGQIYLENEYGTELNLLSFNRVVRQRQGCGEIYLEYEDVIEHFDFLYTAHQLPAHQTIETNRNGQQIRYLFNRYGNIVFREEYARINGIPKLIGTHYRYNKDGNLVGTISPEGIITQFLYGRDYYEKKHQIDFDYIATEDSNLTIQNRQSFNRLLVSVRRGKQINALNLNQGLWSDDIFRDIFDIAQEDMIQKFVYEPEFGQPLSISDPRFTKNANPDIQEDSNYDKHLTTFHYKTQNGSSYFLMDKIIKPVATSPDGALIGSAITQFLTYDSRGRLTKAEDEKGLVSNFEYYNSGVKTGMLQKTILDPLGFNIRNGVERDDLGRVIKAFEPRSFESQDGRFVSEMTINALGQVTETVTSSPFKVKLKSKFDKTGNTKERIQEVKDTHGSFLENQFLKTQYIYDQEFKLIKTVEGDVNDTLYRSIKTVYDGVNRPFLTISPTGRKNKIIYNERSLPYKEIVDYGGIGVNTKKFYDAEGRVIRMIDQRGGTHRQKYDALGRIIETSNSEGNITAITYDKLGNKLTERFFEKIGVNQFVLKSRKEFHYDELGRLIKQGVNLFENNIEIVNNTVSSYLANGPGRLLETRFFYDRSGRLIKTIDASNRQIFQEYDILGRIKKQIDPDDNETEYQYDSADNVIRVDKKESVKNSDNNIVGNRFFATQKVYDELNRIVATIDTLGNETKYQYDTRGLLTKKINALNEETEGDFDVFGRLLKSTQYLTNVSNPGLKIPVSVLYQYDLDNLVTRQIDALARETRFIYNSLGLPTTIILPEPDLSEDLKAYDTAGTLSSYKDRNGLLNVYRRDIVGRIIEHKTDTSLLTAGNIIEGATFTKFSFDSLGRIFKTENDFSLCEYQYNSLGWLIDEISTTKPIINDIITEPLSIKRDYNDNGAVIKMYYPSGRQLQYQRDVLDRLTSIAQIAKGTNFSGNADIPQQYTIANITFEGLQRKSVKRANNAETQYNYDFGGKMVGINHSLNETNLLQMQFLYDAVGNMRLKSELADEFQSIKGFQYDALHRLISTQVDNQAIIHDLTTIKPFASKLPDTIPNSQSLIDNLIIPVSNTEKEYELDVVGNRKKIKTSGIDDIDYNINTLDQYDAVDGVNYKYDKNGNLVDDGQIEYRYDFKNQLISAIRKADGVKIVSFVFDTAGRKIIENYNNSIRQSVYRGINPIETYENGILDSSLVLDNGIDNYLQISTQGKDLYVLSDLVKSTRYVLNDAQKERFYTYDDFGKVNMSNQATSDDSFLFQGKKWISEIEKYDYFARFYDPVIGRFIQRDTKGFVDGTNMYAFVGNNPLSMTDPFGTEGRDEVNTSTGGHNTSQTITFTPINNSQSVTFTPIPNNQKKDDDHWLLDNSVWNFVTNDGVGFVPSFIEKLHKLPDTPFDILDDGNPIAKSFTENRKLYKAWLKPPSGLDKASYWLHNKLNIAPIKIINNILAPLGLISNADALIEAIYESKKNAPEQGADIAAASAGLLSAFIGTLEIVGTGLRAVGVKGLGGVLGRVAGVLNPIGLVLGALAGGYAIGSFINEKTGASHDAAMRGLKTEQLLKDGGINDTVAGIVGGVASLPVFGFLVTGPVNVDKLYKDDIFLSDEEKL
jgi:RHS repeat-associated protein